MKTADQAAIRRRNLCSILYLLSHNPGMTRQELANATGLSLMSVTNLVDQLNQQHALDFTIQHKAEPRAGRRAERLYLNSETYAWLVVNLTSRVPAYRLFDLDFTTLLEGTAQNERQSLAAFIGEMRTRVEETLDRRVLLGTAIITPGPYDAASDTIRNQRLPELNGEKLLSLFRSQLGHHAYLVDEDVKFAVRAFDDPVVPSKEKLLYYLYIGEGVGGALMHDGSIVRGLNATTGDIGQLLTPQGETCESRLSTDHFASLLELDDLSQLEIYARQQPERYQHHLLQAAHSTAEMLHSVLWLIDPERIIIDCAYARPFGNLFLSALHDALLERCEAGRILPKLSLAPQQPPSVLRGALAMLQRQWLEQIAP